MSSLGSGSRTSCRSSSSGIGSVSMLAIIAYFDCCSGDTGGTSYDILRRMLLLLLLVLSLLLLLCDDYIRSLWNNVAVVEAIVSIHCRSLQYVDSVRFRHFSTALASSGGKQDLAKPIRVIQPDSS